jgi:hypothetical protein
VTAEVEVPAAGANSFTGTLESPPAEFDVVEAEAEPTTGADDDAPGE